MASTSAVPARPNSTPSASELPASTSSLHVVGHDPHPNLRQTPGTRSLVSPDTAAQGRFIEQSRRNQYAVIARKPLHSPPDRETCPGLRGQPHNPRTTPPHLQPSPAQSRTRPMTLIPPQPAWTGPSKIADLDAGGSGTRRGVSPSRARMKLSEIDELARRSNLTIDGKSLLKSQA